MFISTIEDRFVRVKNSLAVLKLAVAASPEDAGMDADDAFSAFQPLVQALNAEVHWIREALTKERLCHQAPTIDEREAKATKGVTR